jgi:hypothetical protein
MHRSPCWDDCHFDSIYKLDMLDQLRFNYHALPQRFGSRCGSGLYEFSGMVNGNIYNHQSFRFDEIAYQTFKNFPDLYITHPPTQLITNSLRSPARPHRRLPEEAENLWCKDGVKVQDVVHTIDPLVERSGAYWGGVSAIYCPAISLTTVTEGGGLGERL